MAKKKGKKRSQKQGVNASTTNAQSRAGSTQAQYGWWDDRIARVIRMFVAGALGAAVLSLIVWVLSLGLFNVNPMTVPPSADSPVPLNPMAVLLACAIPALGAAIVYHFMSRALGERTWRTFVIVAVVLGVLSLFPIWTMAVSTGSKVVLSLMHIVSVVGILWGIRYTLGYFPETISRWAGATG